MPNELIIELPKDTALQVFTEPQGVDKYINQIRQEALSLVPDITTKKGRDEIASVAHWVSRSKTYLEKTGKDLCDAERAKIDVTLKAVMASRKRVESELDAIRDKVRKPLTDWENAESERKSKIESRIEAMQRLPEIGSNSDAITKHLRRLESTEIDESFCEFTAEAALARTRSIKECRAKLEAQLQVENDQKELAELKAKQAEQDRINREREIATKAAEDAKLKAEQESQNKVDAANAELEKERAAIRETERLEELKIAEENKRKSDENHKHKIRSESIAALEKCGFTNELATNFVHYVESEKVSHITINF